MLRKTSKLQGCRLDARDGTIGKVKDLLFDDESWSIRYLVANTGRWLPRRRVLLSPFATVAGAMMEDKIPVDLTKVQIENSPGIETDEPVSDQHQRALHAYYGWPAYWTVGPYPMAGVMPPIAATLPGLMEETPPVAAGSGDRHLRSIDYVTGYRLHATDGAIGRVDDFIVDTDEWMIRMIIVDTHDWLPGRKVLVAPASVDRSSWSDDGLRLAMTRDAIMECPEYSADAELDGDFEQRVSAYFGHVTAIH